MTNHLTEALNQIIYHATTVHNGCLIYYTKGEYVWNRKVYNTIQQAKGAIDKALLSLKSSIQN